MTGAAIGAVAGAVFGAALGEGKGRVLGAALGALAGGIIGGAIGRQLDAADRERIAQATRTAVLTGRDQAWEGERSGNRGTVKVASSEQRPTKVRVAANKARIESMPPLDLIGDTFEATARANVRSGPGREYKVVEALAPGERLARAAERLSIDRRQIDAWAAGQTPWSAEQLWRVAELALEQFRAAGQIARLETEVRSLSVNLATTYEEISLLHRLANNLKISQSDEQLGRIAVEWLGEVLPAAGFALQFLPVVRSDVKLDHQARNTAVLLTHGQCPLDQQQFDALIAHVKPALHGRPTVLNRSVTGHPGWPFPQVRQAIVVALVEGENLFGWLAAVNHRQDREFGTIEASLLSSVAAILGIHSGNIELYRQQSELLAGIVRALTSAIDAKDPYTCGHSDRVARISVRLAEELGCDAKMLNAIYLAGLLHDIGKIGIDDSVLRKPGRLSDEEYAHIKRHVEIGHRILRDLHKLEDVLPVVLHHHESWDGDGYPNKLSFHEIPLAARIVAVADSYDAMSSDRPYRAGMPEEKIDAIFRAGAGKQWDPEVVAAFFSARDDIRAIARGQ